jgi:hypothetical protein
VQADTNINTHARTHIHTHKHTHIACRNTQTNNTHTRTHAHTHKTHTLPDVYTRSQRHACTHARACMIQKCHASCTMSAALYSFHVLSQLIALLAWLCEVHQFSDVECHLRSTCCHLMLSAAMCSSIYYTSKLVDIALAHEHVPLIIPLVSSYYYICVIIYYIRMFL